MLCTHFLIKLISAYPDTAQADLPSLVHNPAGLLKHYAGQPHKQEEGDEQKWRSSDGD
jgi:hypothetical protein